MKKWILVILMLGVGAYFLIQKNNPILASLSDNKVGQAVDSLNGVYVYYNGSVGNVEG